jgi:hypothetical protein
MIETADSLRVGENIGEVTLEDGAVHVNVDDAALRARLEKLFSSPLKARSGDPSGLLNITFGRTVQPGTEEFFRCVGEILEGPEFRIMAKVEE